MPAELTATWPYIYTDLGYSRDFGLLFVPLVLVAQSFPAQPVLHTQLETPAHLLQTPIAACAASVEAHRPFPEHTAAAHFCRSATHSAMTGPAVEVT